MNRDSDLASSIVEDPIIPEVVVQTIYPEAMALGVETGGVVLARTQLKILPEVSGRIEWVSPKWHDGGFFKQGELMFKLEDHLFKNNVAKANAQLAESNARFIQEQGMVNVAKQEWQKRKNKSQDPAAKSLALREPQYASAKAAYEAARSDLNVAKLNLSRASFYAPFDGVLVNKIADKGQLISSNQAIADFYAIDFVEIRIPLNQSQRSLVDLPSLNSSLDLPVKVTQTFGTEEVTYEGKLIRTESVLDEQTKVLYAVVAVENPYQIDAIKP
ncbi:MAG: HlyD family efflux transporter periplasmic adaptor subunit, partial [Pseudomonadales bacterium]|nr:HlyD family efflux transporter periplasmic adaptor subunit [Pseudomonadales bacterium]